ncbi:MAG: hypothetical protein ACREXW_04210 [Gammaproteobacteria bacterium]
MSTRLGLGSRLIDSPEEARSPEVAARIICAIFIDRLPKFQEALEKNDLDQVRRLLVRSDAGIDEFTAAYDKAPRRALTT